MPTIFFDVVKSSQFSDGVVRFALTDFVGASPDGKRIANEDVTYLATTLPGLLQLQSQVNQMIDGLLEKQVLRKQDNKTNPS